MGQKVNPHGLRVGVIKDWESRWYADKSSFGNTLIADYEVREYLLMAQSQMMADKRYNSLQIYYDVDPL